MQHYTPEKIFRSQFSLVENSKTRSYANNDIASYFLKKRTINVRSWFGVCSVESGLVCLGVQFQHFYSLKVRDIYHFSTKEWVHTETTDV